MKKWALLLVLVPAIANAGQFCNTYKNNSGGGTRTYCDDGTAWYQNGNGYIYNNRNGTNYHQYGNTLYGNDGSWRTKGKSSGGTTSTQRPYTEDDKTVDSIFRKDGVFDD